MSEIYLTKIERKTIFTKSLIFVLIMFIISDLTVTGPFYFNFIPWLYILGVVGSVKKIDNILMGIIGTFTVFISSLIVQGGINLTCIISTVISLFLLILGIITGKIIFEFVLEHRLVKYIKPSRKTIYIISIILMTIISFVIVGLNNGNIVTYLKSRANLEKYITNTYDIQEIDILSTKYNRKVVGDYVYTVRLDGQDVYFVPIANGIFKDANMSERLELLNKNLDDETNGKVLEIKSNYPLLTNATVKFSLGYAKLGVLPDETSLHIECEQEQENIDEAYEQIAQCIKELQNLKQTQKVVIEINNLVLQISEDNIQKITKEYIKGGYEVEEISE